jgi:hypothetical protein
MLLDSDSFTLIEKKTGKNRIIKINSGFQNHIKDCFKALNIQNKLEKCFLSNLEELSSYMEKIRANAVDEQVKKLVVSADDTCVGLRNLMSEYEELLHEVKDNISKMGEAQLGVDD